MTRGAKILVGLVGAVVVLGIAGFAGWYFLIRSEAEPRAKIEETPVQEEGTLDGTYQLQAGTDSFVGYRVQEQFAGALESTATGRTGDVTGTFAITGNRVEQATMTANLLTLASDRAMRDNRIRTLGLESEQFPESTFVLTEPIELPEEPTPGETVEGIATGDFTLHGVTRRVEISIEGRWDGRVIQVVGNLPVVFADYDMETPSIAGFVTVRDEGEMEFQLFFEPTGAGAAPE